jgi:hypothetical protein
MKKTLLTCLIHIIMLTAISFVMAESQESEIEIHRAQQMIDQQIEKIGLIREQADSELALARLRMGEQLRKTREDLARQMEILEQYREKLAEQRQNAETAVSGIRKNWAGMIDKASAEVESGIQDTNYLLTKIQSLDTDVSDQSSGKDSMPCNDSNKATTEVSVQPTPQTSDSSGKMPPRVGGG